MARRSAIAASALLWCAQALAQSQPPTYAFEVERLELNPSGVGSMTVGSGELLPAGSFRSSAMAHYENEPLFLVEGAQSRGRLIRERLTLHLTRQYSLGQRVEIALALPIVVFQSGDNLASDGFTPLATGGLASPYLSARLGVLCTVDGSPFDLALQAGTALPFGNPFAFGRNPGLTFVPRLLASKRIANRFMLSAEAGGLLRPPVLIGDYWIHNEMQLNAALSTYGTALRGEVAVRSAYYFGRAPTSIEALGGARYALTDRVELNALVGVGVLRAPGTPAFRVLFGASFLEGTRSQDFAAPPPVEKKPAETKPAEKKPDDKRPGDKKPVCEKGKPHLPAECPELDDDGDGIKNSADLCPTTPEDFDGYPDSDGCPDPDNDADGVKDADDKCPLNAGKPELQGCPVPDKDGDGVLDEEDACPDEAGPKERKGCPLKDSDGDGIVDTVDGCPNEKGPMEARGCPIKDTDGDGVPDHLDNCPTVKGTQDNHGCPAAEKQRVVITREKIVILEQVNFATNSARVLPSSVPLLQQVAKIMKEHPDIRKVEVGGHTDNVGGAIKNLRLSRERAESVRKYLVEQGGIEPARLDAKGYGESRPIMPNSLARGRAANRRVEFVIQQDDSIAIPTPAD